VDGITGRQKPLPTFGETCRREDATVSTGEYLETGLMRYINKLAQNEYLRDNLMPKILPRLLEEGIIQPNRVRLFNQGSLQDRCQEALDVVRNGQVNGEKVVVKVASV